MKNVSVNEKESKKHRGGAFLHESLLAEKANRKKKNGPRCPKNAPYNRGEEKKKSKSMRLYAYNWREEIEE